MTTSFARARRLLLPALVAALTASALPARAQKKADAEQTKKAVERSENAARILTTVVGMAEKGIPVELLDKARAVAVFPHVVKAKVLFQQMTLGFGVISRRLPEGWGPPAYYTFSGAGWDLSIAGGEAADVVMLFMNDTAADWFQKGRLELKGEKKAVAGPVGGVPADGKDKIAAANILLYVLDDGRLAGAGISSNFFLKSFYVVPDNKLNKAIYNAKSRDTLAGRAPVLQTAPPGVTAFQQALTRHLPPR
ncbi:MAG TPA: lipid-binding SYLF domain-containing protein [Pyrinomonadaceae bacterium]|nr:lipid-binding SYLF domain-containing protein [Pyrinomonadaceae bacterium]